MIWTRDHLDVNLEIPDTTHVTAIYAAPLTPLAPPQLIGIYGSPMECLGIVGEQRHRWIGDWSQSKATGPVYQPSHPQSSWEEPSSKRCRTCANGFG